MIALPGGERLRRQLHQRLATSTAPARCCSTTSSSSPAATTSTGRRTSARTSRRRATPASTSPSSAATRSSGRRAGPTAATASNTPYRTLITYKETHFNAPTDPQDPATWTGAWGDPRFSPPADGGNPANSLTGQMFVVNSGTLGHHRPLPVRQAAASGGTPRVAELTSGQSADARARHRNARLRVGRRRRQRLPARRASSTSPRRRSAASQTFTDYGSTNRPATAATETHHLTLYRAPSGALVFGAGTVQWAWGLDNTNAWDNFGTDPTGNPPDPNMQQATVNLFADMGVQPDDADVRPARPAPRRPTRRRRPRRSRSPTAGANLAGRQLRSRSPAPRPTPAAASSPASRSRPTAATTWHPAN